MRQGRSILSDISLTVADGEVLGIVGPNGSGKTTLLRAMYRAERPSSGTVRIDGRAIDGMRRAEIARRIAVVPQERPGDGEQTVGDLIRLGRLPHRSWWQVSIGDDRRVAQAAARVALSGLLHRPIATLSGGEMQRALLARALCQDSPHLLLDEPTNHLDLRYQHELLALVASLGLTAVIVLHDLNLAARYCQRIALLDRGELLACGPAAAALDPTLLETVYRLPVTRLTTPGGRHHLVFSDSSQPASGPTP